MFFSELREMIFINKELEFEQDILAYQPMIDESNNAYASIFGELLKKNSFDNLHSIYEKLKLEYVVTTKRNELATYNYERIFD